MIRLLRRLLKALLGDARQPPELEPAERLDAAHQRLKDTIPPPDD